SRARVRPADLFGQLARGAPLRMDDAAARTRHREPGLRRRRQSRGRGRQWRRACRRQRGTRLHRPAVAGAARRGAGGHGAAGRGGAAQLARQVSRAPGRGCLLVGIRSARNMKKPTLVNHPPGTAPPPGNQPVIAPIYQSVKFEFENIDETLRMLRGETPGYFYMRASNPTTRQLELTLAALQGRDDCIATASGVNAIAQTLIALTRTGDHVLCFIETYGPTRNIIRRLLARFGVEHTLLSIDDMAGVESVLASRPTRLVMFESPTNPVTKVADIERLVELAHRHGALAVMDNTFAGFHQHDEYEIDVFVHSLTKYASGTGDVMGGAVIGRHELIEGMRPDFSVLGALLDPHAAFVIQR